MWLNDVYHRKVYNMKVWQVNILKFLGVLVALYCSYWVGLIVYKLAGLSPRMPNGILDYPGPFLMGLFTGIILSLIIFLIYEYVTD